MSKTTPSRYASRSSTELQEVLQVLEATDFCTVSYCTPEGPMALPTGFCIYKNELIIHGSVKSHFLGSILAAGKVCITTFCYDGLVLATSALEHSVNYRSVAVFSEPRPIQNERLKREMLKTFTDKYLPGRWEHLRPMTETEMTATTVISFTLNKASVKQRTGPPAFKKDAWFHKVWSGILPVHTRFLEPLPHPQLPDMDIPDHISNLLDE